MIIWRRFSIILLTNGAGAGFLHGRKKPFKNSALSVRLVLHAFTGIGDQTSNQADHDAAWQNSTHPLIRS
jgi:hypothetical protein